MTVWVTVKRWRNRYVHSSPRTWRADHKCDSDRRVAWTITQRTVNAEEQMPLSKWMSKGYRGEVAKFAELSRFRSIAKQSKLAEQWKDAHWVGKLKRADEQLLVIRGLTRSARTGQKQARDEVEFGQCQSSVESYSGIESKNRYGHIS